MSETKRVYRSHHRRENVQPTVTMEELQASLATVLCGEGKEEERLVLCGGRVVVVRETRIVLR